MQLHGARVPAEPYAKTFLEGARAHEGCDWCGRGERKNRMGLCRHCNEVRKDLELVEKETSRASEPNNFMLEWDLDVSRERKQDCIAWGQMLHGILSGPVDGLALEGWFRLLARHIARDKRMHFGTASMLAWTFTAEQRQVLAYLFWEIFGAQASHNRQSRALTRVQNEKLKAGRV